MNVCACLVVIFVNNQLVKYGGDMAVGAYGIANAVATVFVMFVMGLNQGMQPIAGYNYGSQQIDRLMRVLALTTISATCIMTAAWLVAEFLPAVVARMFTTDRGLIKIASTAIRINMMVYPIVGMQMVVTNFFQCIGKVKVSIFLSLSRQLLFLLPLLAILPHFLGVNGVWCSLPSADTLASLVAITVLIIFVRRFNRQAAEAKAKTQEYKIKK